MTSQTCQPPAWAIQPADASQNDEERGAQRTRLSSDCPQSKVRPNTHHMSYEKAR